MINKEIWFSQCDLLDDRGIGRMQTQKWVNLGLLLGSTAVFLFLGKLLGAIWDMVRLPAFALLSIESYYLLSFLVALGVGIAVRRNVQANGFLNDVVVELSRVTWPQRKETVASAGVVIVLVGIAALLLFLIDSLWGTMIRGLMAL